MWYFLDVDYRASCAIAAGIGCLPPGDPAFGAPIVSSRRVVTTAPVADYEPGSFFKRELPCLLALLAQTDAFAEAIDALVIDGYVSLAEGRPGLGAHLYRALDERYPVIGIAKTSFHENDAATPVFRGSSQKPLFVTAVGAGELSNVAESVRNLPGDFRLPDMVKMVDHICREACVDLGDTGARGG